MPHQGLIPTSCQLSRTEGPSIEGFNTSHPRHSILLGLLPGPDRSYKATCLIDSSTLTCNPRATGQTACIWSLIGCRLLHECFMCLELRRLVSERARCNTYCPNPKPPLDSDRCWWISTCMSTYLVCYTSQGTLNFWFEQTSFGEFLWELIYQEVTS